MIEQILLHLGAPHYPWMEARISSGPWKLQRAKDPGFRLLEVEIHGRGPRIVDNGPEGLGIPLDGRTHYYRLVRPDGSTTKPLAVVFPRWTEYSPYDGKPRTGGKPVPVQAIRWVRLPRFVYAEGREAIWKKYGTRLCHRVLMQGLDLAQLAVDIYNELFFPSDRQKLDAKFIKQYPGMGFAGQILDWLLDSAYRLSLRPTRFIVGPQSPLYGKELKRRHLISLIRNGVLETPDGPVRLYQWMPRSPLRVHADWMANIQPDSRPEPSWRVGIGEAGAALQIVHDDPMMVSYRPGWDLGRPEVIGTTDDRTLDYRVSDQVLASLLGSGPYCEMLAESSPEMVDRVRQSLEQRGRLPR